MEKGNGVSFGDTGWWWWLWCGGDFIGSDCIIFGLAWNELEKRNVVSGLGVVVVVMVVVWGDFIGSDIRERFESHLSLFAQT